MECTCWKCVGACKKTPGVFAPGEAAKAAEFLGLTLKEFFDKYLVVVWRMLDEEDDWKIVFMFTPARVNETTGTERIECFKQAPCIFLENDRCRIHPVKPMECSMYLGCSEIQGSANREKISSMWKDHQNEIDSVWDGCNSSVSDHQIP